MGSAASILFASKNKEITNSTEISSSRDLRLKNQLFISTKDINAEEFQSFARSTHHDSSKHNLRNIAIGNIGYNDVHREYDTSSINKGGNSGLQVVWNDEGNFSDVRGNAKPIPKTITNCSANSTPRVASNDLVVPQMKSRRSSIQRHSNHKQLKSQRQQKCTPSSSNYAIAPSVLPQPIAPIEGKPIMEDDPDIFMDEKQYDLVNNDLDEDLSPFQLVVHSDEEKSDTEGDDVYDWIDSNQYATFNSDHKEILPTNTELNVPFLSMNEDLINSPRLLETSATGDSSIYPSNMMAVEPLATNNSAISMVSTVGPQQALKATTLTSRAVSAQSNDINQRISNRINLHNHTVKETRDVKRNIASLPQVVDHKLPVTGNWLDKRYSVNNYLLLDNLGKGSYGEVRLCRLKPTDKLFAIKIISRDLVKKRKSGNTTETYFEDIKREIAIMKKLLHPNILRLYEVLDDPKVNKLYLVLEYMKRGDLLNYLKEKNEDTDVPVNPKNTMEKKQKKIIVNENDLWDIFKQVAEGIRYLHYQNIVHGDIKPQNLLVSKDGVVKIADFGISRMLVANEQKLTDAAGTPAFMSPELCSGEAFSGQLADVWALGATMFMLRFGHPPFVAKTIINLYNKIQNDPLVFPFPIDNSLQDLLASMMIKDPQLRFTLNQVIAHSWLQIPPAGNTTMLPGIVSKKPSTSASEGISRVQSPRGLIPIDHLSVASGSIPLSVSKLVNSSNRVVGSSHEIQSATLPDPNQTNSSSYAQGNFQDSYIAGNIDNTSVDSSAIETQIKLEEEVAEENMLDTNWGNDVFEIVGDNDIEVGSSDGDDSDKDSVDEEPDNSPQIQSQPPVVPKTTRKVVLPALDTGTSSSNMKLIDSSESSIPVMSSSPSAAGGARSIMDVDEETRRSLRFQVKIRRSSNLGTPLNAIKLSQTSPLAVVSDDKLKSFSTTQQAGQVQERSISGYRILPPTLSATSMSSVESTPNFSSRTNSIGGDDEPNELSLDQFSSLMDTLIIPISSEQMEERSQSSKSAVFNRNNIICNISNPQTRIGMASHSEQGKRDTQEDFILLVPDLEYFYNMNSISLGSQKSTSKLKKMTLCGIFDGHNGMSSSLFLYQHYAGVILDFIFENKTLEDVLNLSAASIDEKLCKALQAEDDISGSTGAIVLYDGNENKLFVSNVGDSMCVKSVNGEAVKLSRMHRPDDENERKRVELCGGIFVNNRVNGVINITRAYGDYPLKDDSQNLGSIISTPDVFVYSISSDIEFVIVACDGLWDVFSPQTAVNFVRSQLSISGDRLKTSTNLSQVTQSLATEAIARGSMDNVSIIILVF